MMGYEAKERKERKGGFLGFRVQERRKDGWQEV